MRLCILIWGFCFISWWGWWVFFWWWVGVRVRGGGVLGLFCSSSDNNNNKINCGWFLVFLGVCWGGFSSYCSKYWRGGVIIWRRVYCLCWGCKWLVWLWWVMINLVREMLVMVGILLWEVYCWWDCCFKGWGCLGSKIDGCFSSWIWSWYEGGRDVIFGIS